MLLSSSPTPAVASSLIKPLSPSACRPVNLSSGLANPNNRHLSSRTELQTSNLLHKVNKSVFILLARTTPALALRDRKPSMSLLSSITLLPPFFSTMVHSPSAVPKLRLLLPKKSPSSLPESKQLQSLPPSLDLSRVVIWPPSNPQVSSCRFRVLLKITLQRQHHLLPLLIPSLHLAPSTWVQVKNCLKRVDGCSCSFLVWPSPSSSSSWSLLSLSTAAALSLLFARWPALRVIVSTTTQANLLLPRKNMMII